MDDLKKLRTEKIIRLGELEQTHCKRCERFEGLNKGSGYIHPDTICGGCSIYDSIRGLGEELCMITVKKSKRPRKITRKWPSKMEMAAAYKTLDRKYKQWKFSGKSDREIADMVGLGVSSITKWKKLNGLLPDKTKEMGSEPVRA